MTRQIAAADVVSEVILIDEDGRVAEGKALDILQAGPVDRYSTRVTGTTDYSRVVAADAIVLADRHGPTSVEWQEDGAVALLRRVAQINERAPLLCAGARQLDTVDRGVREAGISATRLFGSAPEALRSAVISMTALEAECSPTDISLIVVGRPPSQIIVPWEDASIAGRRATDVLSPPAITRLDARLARFWPPAPFTLAAAVTRVLIAAATRANHTVSAFVADTRGDGERRTGMLPVSVGPRGIVAVHAPQLSARDRVRLESALQR